MKACKNGSCDIAPPPKYVVASRGRLDLPDVSTCHDQWAWKMPEYQFLAFVETFEEVQLAEKRFIAAGHSATSVFVRLKADIGPWHGNAARLIRERPQLYMKMKVLGRFEE